jgi:hypothetical protein
MLFLDFCNALTPVKSWYVNYSVTPIALHPWDWQGCSNTIGDRENQGKLPCRNSSPGIWWQLVTLVPVSQQGHNIRSDATYRLLRRSAGNQQVQRAVSILHFVMSGSSQISATVMTLCRTERAKRIKGQVNDNEQQQCVDWLLSEVVSCAGYSIPLSYLKQTAKLLTQLFPEAVKIMPALRHLTLIALTRRRHIRSRSF